MSRQSIAIVPAHLLARQSEYDAEHHLLVWHFADAGDAQIVYEVVRALRIESACSPYPGGGWAVAISYDAADQTVETF